MGQSEPGSELVGTETEQGGQKVAVDAKALFDLVAQANNALLTITGYAELLLMDAAELQDRPDVAERLTAMAQAADRVAADLAELSALCNRAEATEIPAEAPPASPGQGLPEDTGDTPAGTEQAARSLQVLVVDDEPEVRRLLSEYLAVDGHSCQTAADGPEALEKFTTETFDLVIVDQVLPGMPGDRLAGLFKVTAPEMPIIMLAGGGALMQARGDVPETVDLLLAKPISLAQLREALGRVTQERTGGSRAH